MLFRSLRQTASQSRADFLGTAWALVFPRCQVCGFDGEIRIVEDDGKLVWECPHCHNRDQSKLNVARRTCGYIGTQFWNQGRTAEIKDRVLHL